MPKVGMEPLRRAALLDATIAEIAAAGTLEVTVGQIARRAGVSSGLAHHYFGGKDQIFSAAMRRILTDFGAEVRAELKSATTPVARLEAIIRASFAPSCFAEATIAAWMALYALARTDAEAARLVSVYHARLHSNLVHALRPLSPTPEAEAETLAALIDGLYLRAALGRVPADKARALALGSLSRFEARS